jgi:hypothetical protein
VALDTPASLAVRARGGKSVRFLPSAPFDQALLTARDVQLDSSSLEDAFVKLTGKNLDPEGVLA